MRDSIGRKWHLQENTLRRQTHVFCRNCCQNMKEYGRIRCDRCLVKLNDSRLSYHTIKRLPLREKLSCVFESWYERNLTSRVNRKENV